MKGKSLEPREGTMKVVTMEEKARELLEMMSKNVAE